MRQTKTYTLPLSTALVDSGWPLYGLVCDAEFDQMPDSMDTEAKVRSGDYLATLITTLDEISQSLPADCQTQQVQIERAISDLLYIDKRYKLTRK